MKQHRTRPRAPFFALALSALLLLGCGSDPVENARPCEERCRDNIAIRAVRETMKLVFNLTLQANDVGEQDETTDCPTGGSAHVFGTATSVPEQGATKVDLTYELTDCGYLERDDERDENYDVTISATLTQKGTLAVQPSETSALLIDSDSLTLRGTVSDPPLDYEAVECALDLTQNGDEVSGTLCGRSGGIEL